MHVIAIYAHTSFGVRLSYGKMEKRKLTVRGKG